MALVSATSFITLVLLTLEPTSFFFVLSRPENPPLRFDPIRD